MDTPRGNFDFARLWDEKTVALFLGVSVEFLQQDRVRSKRVPFIKLGRVVRYDPADVKAFTDRCKVSA